MSHYHRNLIHVCDVQRAAHMISQSGERIPNWQIVAQDVQCRYVQKLERFADESATEEAVLVDMLLLRYDAPVQRLDRVTRIRTKTGDMVDDGPFTITSLLLRNSRTYHHQSAILDRVGDTSTETGTPGQLWLDFSVSYHTVSVAVI